MLHEYFPFDARAEPCSKARASTDPPGYVTQNATATLY
ncbi:hypothetical protein FHS06_000508 [Microbacterium halimionae]|nr:hypothetical protein [Microbacterium halimionae]